MNSLLLERIPEGVTAQDVEAAAGGELLLPDHAVRVRNGSAVLHFRSPSALASGGDNIRARGVGGHSVSFRILSSTLPSVLPPPVRAPPRILCFGDSNTWGTHPVDRDVRLVNRWPLSLARLLQCHVVEEGCGGRTAARDDPRYPVPIQKNGLSYLSACLHSHRPLDAAIIMLGTNDAKAHFNLSADDIADHIMSLVECVRTAPRALTVDGSPLPVLLVANPHVSFLDAGSPGSELQSLREDFIGAREKLQALPEKMRSRVEAARAAGDEALDLVVLSDRVQVGVDGVHFEEGMHVLMAQCIANGLTASFPSVVRDSYV